MPTLHLTTANFDQSDFGKSKIYKTKVTISKRSKGSQISLCKRRGGVFCLCQKTQIRSSKEKFPNCSSMFTAICESPTCREINKKKYFAKTVPVEFYHQYNLPVKHLFQKEMDIFFS